MLNNLYFSNPMQFVDGAAGTYGFKSSSSTGLQFLSNSTTPRMAIDLNGNVGIGTTAPTSPLYLVASGAKTATFTSAVVSNTATSSTVLAHKYGLDIQSTGVWNGSSARNVGLHVNVSGGSNNYPAIFEGGNVGIGPSNYFTTIGAPLYPLEVAVSGNGLKDVASFYNRNSTIQVGDGSRLLFSARREDEGGPGGVYQPLGGVAGILTDNTSFDSFKGALVFYTVPALYPNYPPNGGMLTEQARLTGDGNLGIGTANPGYNIDALPSSKFFTLDAGTNDPILEVVRNTSSSNYGNGQIDFLNTHNTTYKRIAYIQALTNGTTTNKGGHLRFFTKGDAATNNGQERMRITSTGNIGIGTTNPDSRLTIGDGSPTAPATVNIYGDNTGATVANVGTINLFGQTDQKLVVRSPSDGTPGLLQSQYGLDLVYGVGGSYNLSIKKNTTTMLTLDPSGNLGLGTTSPLYKLHVIATGTDAALFDRSDVGGRTGVVINSTAGQQAVITLRDAQVSKWQVGKNTDNNFFVFDADPSRQRDVIRISQADGNLFLQPVGGCVGIGTTSFGPTTKLAVEGVIGAREVNVTAVGTPFPDYVFDDDYHVVPLAQLEKQIRQDKHLPEMPSAGEVKKKGINLGEMQTKLLKKVEELTLYVIEQNKKLTTL
ncbi:MAG TPA: hypothetical protein VJ508_11415, partial [Saprospiraceae bacterium]|nr:hypothetical protein [Saprospiraceae bacterium]